jgi:hypothetical protein
VQLISTQTNSYIWVDTYNRKLTDITAVESEIARGIAESLQVKLTAARSAGLNSQTDKQFGSLRCISTRPGI